MNDYMQKLDDFQKRQVEVQGGALENNLKTQQLSKDFQSFLGKELGVNVENLVTISHLDAFMWGWNLALKKPVPEIVKP